MMRVLLCLGALVLASGCVAVRPPATTPATLDGANEVLHERWATVALADGREVRAQDVVLATDSTRFTDRATDAVQTIATARIDSVWIRGRSGVGHGALAFATPGLLIAAGGLVALTQTEANGSAIGAVFLTAGGVVLAVGGAVVGAVIGAVITPGRPFVAYRRPEPPLDPPPRPPLDSP